MFDCLALSGCLAFPEQLYAFSCGSFPSMNDYSNKIVSSRNVLPLGQFWSIYEPAHIVVIIWNRSRIPGCFPFGFGSFFLFFFFSFFFFSYYNSEVWLKSVGVEQDQLCLRAFSNPVVNMLYSSSLEGNPMVHYRTTGELGQGCLSQDSFCCCFSITVVCKSWNEARGTVINVPNSFNLCETWGFNEIIQPLSLDCKSSPKWERPSCSLQLLISSWNTWELGI